ncbi:MAG: hypothetical protein R2860_05630 [Desulfobacterales bacterium]
MIIATLDTRFSGRSRSLDMDFEYILYVGDFSWKSMSRETITKSGFQSVSVQVARPLPKLF